MSKEKLDVDIEQHGFYRPSGKITCDTENRYISTRIHTFCYKNGDPLFVIGPHCT